MSQSQPPHPEAARRARLRRRRWNAPTPPRPPDRGATVYILRCADGGYFTGVERRTAEDRPGEPPRRLFDNPYTLSRRPVMLLHAVRSRDDHGRLCREGQDQGLVAGEERGLYARGLSDACRPRETRRPPSPPILSLSKERGGEGWGDGKPGFPGRLRRTPSPASGRRGFIPPPRPESERSSAPATSQRSTSATAMPFRAA